MLGLQLYLQCTQFLIVSKNIIGSYAIFSFIVREVIKMSVNGMILFAVTEASGEVWMQHQRRRAKLFVTTFICSKHVIELFERKIFCLLPHNYYTKLHNHNSIAVLISMLNFL